MASTANLPRTAKTAATYACGSSVTDVSLMAVIITLLIVIGVYSISIWWVNERYNCMERVRE